MSQITVSSVANSISSAPMVNNAALTAASVDKIVAELVSSFQKDGATLAKLSTVDRGLNKLVNERKLTPDQAKTIKLQLKEGLRAELGRGGVAADIAAKGWLKMSGAEADQASELRNMARQAATNKSFRFGLFGTKWQKITKGEVSKMLETAAQDGKISLNEINAMYQGISDAHKAGEISDQQRDQMSLELDGQLKGQTGSRKGLCARRVKGKFADKLTPEAKDFLSSIGVKSRPGGRFTRWKMANQGADVKRYVSAITKDGVVSQAERAGLVNMVIRNGEVTNGELVTVRHALADAVRQGFISKDEYRQTLQVFDVEIQRQTGATGISAQHLMPQGPLGTPMTIRG